MTLCLGLLAEGRWALYADKRIVYGYGYSDDDCKLIELGRGVTVATAGDCAAISAGLHKLRKNLAKFVKADVHSLPKLLFKKNEHATFLIRFRGAKSDRLVSVGRRDGAIEHKVGPVAIGCGGESALAILQATDELDYRDTVQCVFDCVNQVNLGVSSEFDSSL